MQNKVGNWLARLSDPRGINSAVRAEPFAADDPRAVRRLVFEARRHSVHFVLLPRLAEMLRTEPASVVRGRGMEERSAALLAELSELRLQDLAPVMVVAAAAREVRAAIAGMPIALVKGLDFAEVLFGNVSNRSFGDIDLLCDPGAEADLRPLLRRLGFEEHAPDRNPDHYTERQWIRSDPHMGQVLLEVHTDMVHSQHLRRRISLPFRRYVDNRNQVTPAGRLILAAVHAATSHLFGRLQYVVDGLMAVRAGVDAQELRERCGEIGALLPLRTLLRLADTLFASDQARWLLETLPAPRGGGLEAKLIPPSMVLAAKGPHRWRFIPQRRLYRRLMMS